VAKTHVIMDEQHGRRQIKTACGRIMWKYANEPLEGPNYWTRGTNPYKAVAVSILFWTGPTGQKCGSCMNRIWPT
jgi:hypothetical protein